MAGLVAAPYGCMLLADLGAEVLRVERADVRSMSLQKIRWWGKRTFRAESNGFSAASQRACGQVADWTSREPRGVALDREPTGPAEVDVAVSPAN